MNKKGKTTEQYVYFIYFIVALLIFFLLLGGGTSLLLQNAVKDIPIWFWIGLVFFVLIVLRRKK